MLRLGTGLDEPDPAARVARSDGPAGLDRRLELGQRASGGHGHGRT